MAVVEQSARSKEIELNGDAILFTSSWEPRCLEVLNASISNIPFSGLIRFEELGRSGRRGRHDAIFLEKIQALSESIELPSLPVADFYGWRDAFATFVTEMRAELGRPIDLVLDISCLPKYYILLILGFGIKSGTIRSLSCFYAEGKYSASSSNAVLAGDHTFTSGEWASFPVPFLEGKLDLDRKIRVIASIGFETFQARKFIRSYEAERHYLVLPSPGFAPEYEDRSDEEAQALANNLDLTKKELIRVHAGSPIGSASAALTLIDETRRYNDLGLCLGTKPQALGMGIAAILRDSFTLVCRIPEHYVEAETSALGYSWKYSIVDLSAPDAPLALTPPPSATPR